MCAVARTQKHRIHIGRTLGICVETGSARPVSDPQIRFKYRVVCQGNHVIDQTWEWAILQDLGSNAASMQAGKVVDSYACVFAHCCQRSDVDQAYVQARRNGFETWIARPHEAWPPEWFYEDGSPMHDQPVTQLLRALYGHPGTGTFWEQPCVAAIVKWLVFEPVQT